MAHTGRTALPSDGRYSRKTFFTASPGVRSPRTTCTAISTPPHTPGYTLDTLTLSPRLLQYAVRRREAESEVLTKLRVSPRLDKLKCAVSSIETLSGLQLRVRRKSTGRVQRSADKPAVLETLEAKWDHFPRQWTLERKVVECSLNPPSRLPAADDPVPKPLIEHLSRSPLGVEVLKEALSHMSRERLYSAGNYANISQALKERSLSNSRAFKRLRRLRAQFQVTL